MPSKTIFQPGEDVRCNSPIYGAGVTLLKIAKLTIGKGMAAASDGKTSYELLEQYREGAEWFNGTTMMPITTYDVEAQVFVAFCDAMDSPSLPIYLTVGGK